MAKRIAAVEEVPVRIEANGHPVAEAACTPEHLEALAAGRLVAEGYLDDSADLHELTTADGPAGVHVLRARTAEARAARAATERRHRREHGCGLRYFTRCAPERIRGRAGSLPLPPLSEFKDLFRDLFAGADRSNDTGGVHAAALTDGTRLVYFVEDVGRHNAVDKLIGLARLDSAELGGLGLVLTARVSGEIALKAARAGLAWIASRSLPTTLALEIADVAGLPVVARAARPEARVFGRLSGADRP